MKQSRTLYRLAACELAGVEAEFVTWEQNGATPTEWVIATNLHRRHLTTSQRAAIAAEALPLLEAEARKRQVHGLRKGASAPSSSKEHNGESRRSREVAAKQFNVGHTTVGRDLQAGADAPEPPLFPRPDRVRFRTG